MNQYKAPHALVRCGVAFDLFDRNRHGRGSRSAGRVRRTAGDVELRPDGHAVRGDIRVGRQEFIQGNAKFESNAAHRIARLNIVDKRCR